MSDWFHVISTFRLDPRGIPTLLIPKAKNLVLSRQTRVLVQCIGVKSQTLRKFVPFLGLWSYWLENCVPISLKATVGGSWCEQLWGSETGIVETRLKSRPKEWLTQPIDLEEKEDEKRLFFTFIVGTHIKTKQKSY